MYDFKFLLRKYRNQIAIGAGIILILIIAITMFFLLRNPDVEIPFIETKVSYAKYYVAGKDNTIQLYDYKGNALNSLSYTNVAYGDRLSEEAIIHADGHFYKLVIEKQTVSGENKTEYRLSAEDLFKYEGSNVQYSYNDESIVILRDDGTFYVWDRTTNLHTIVEPEHIAEVFLLMDNHLIYSSDNLLHSMDISTEETKSINAGAETYYIAKYGDSVIAYNKFGNGNGTTSIFVLNPSDLYIQNLIPQKSTNIYPIVSSTYAFIQKDNQLTVSLIQEDGVVTTKTLNLNLGQDIFSEMNTIIIDDYLYTNKDKQIQIVDIEDKQIEKTLAIESDWFCPMSEPVA